MADVILAGVDDTVLLTVCCGAIIFFIAGLLTFSRLQSSSSTPSTNQQGIRNESHHTYNSEVCPICLGAHRLAVTTNCGHKFCGTCLKSYRNRASANVTIFGNPLSCPLCRQNVNILLLSFTQDESHSLDLEEERYDVERMTHEYNVRFGDGPRTLMSYIRDCPVLLRHMFLEFFTFGGLVWLFKAKVILCCLGAIVYLFVPLDIIPEAVFGMFGFLDDVIIFLLCVIYVSTIYRRVIISRGTPGT